MAVQLLVLVVLPATTTSTRTRADICPFATFLAAGTCYSS